MTYEIEIPLAKLRGLATVVCAVSLLGCGKTDAPVAEAPSQDAGVPEVPATAEVVRTVEQRSPFGNLSVPDNLVLDGDFEFTGRSGQMPWVAFGSRGQGTLNFATGGLCRSGIRCASLATGSEMIGWMAAPKTGGMNVSLWAKPPSGACADVRVFVTDLEGNADGDGLRPEAAKAGPDGWCHFEVDSGSFGGAQPVLFVSTANARVQGPILVDDAVARALPATLKRPLALKPIRLEAAERLRVRFIGDWLRKHRVYGLPERGSFEGPDSQLNDAPRTTLR